MKPLKRLKYFYEWKIYVAEVPTKDLNSFKFEKKIQSMQRFLQIGYNFWRRKVD